MPKANETPPAVRPFVCHGCELSPLGSGGEYAGECPFGCGGAKFHVHAETSKWHCKKGCGEGNVYDFLRVLWTLSHKMTTDYSWLSEHRSLPEESLRAWGVCKSLTTGEWLVPGYGANGGIVNLYRYVSIAGKYRLFPTSGISAAEGTDETAGHGFYRPVDQTFPDAVTHIDVCEGVWDAIAWADALGAGDAKTRAVIATPGCGVWKPSWNRLTNNRTVTFLFDNDHPRANPKTGTTSQAAFVGLKRATGIVSSVDADDAPVEVRYLCWSGKDGDDDPGYTKDAPDGHDLRDLLANGATVEQIAAMIRPVPKKWVDGKGTKRGANQNDQIRPIPCDSWKKLRAACVRAMQWTPELNGALAIMLASVASVREQGEQTCVRVISPPSTGKTMVATMVTTAGRRYVIEDDGMNGFFSGFNDAAKGEEVKDRSLAAKLFDKTLITKEGATLMKSAAREKIISDFRALYDGAATKRYGNGLEWAYQGIRFTWILCGTPAMRNEDMTELGPRFIDYTIMDAVDPLTETSIVRRAIQRQAEAQMSGQKADTTVDPKYKLACQLCGGYVDFLRKNIDELARTVVLDDKTLDRIEKLAVFIEYMRARPSLKNDESADRAMAARVAGQLVKLCKYLCIVFQTKTVTKDVLWLIEKVARDTSFGRTLEIVRVLDSTGRVGLDLRGVCKRTKQDSIQLSRDKEGRYLEFLTRLGALEQFEDADGSAYNRPARWRLSDRFRKLYAAVTREWPKTTDNS